VETKRCFETGFERFKAVIYKPLKLSVLIKPGKLIDYLFNLLLNIRKYRLEQVPAV
jgi:hypothetical protein